MDNSEQGQPSKCPECASVISEDAPLGVCSKCLLEAGIQTRIDKNARTEPPPTVEDLAADFPELELIELSGAWRDGSRLPGAPEIAGSGGGTKAIEFGLGLGSGVFGSFYPGSADAG